MNLIEMLSNGRAHAFGRRISAVFVVLAASAALFSSVAPASAQTAFAPAAVVNDEVVTYYDVQQRALLLQLGGGQPGPQLNQAALEQLIEDHLRVQAAERFGVGATDEELAAAVDEFAQRQGVSREDMLSRLAALGVERTALVDLLRAQVVWRELITGRFGSRATPTEIELDQEIALAAAGKTKSYRLSEIALPAGEGQAAAARQLMSRILNEFAGGAAFADLARRYSRTPSAPNGGDVGWLPETALPPELGQMIAETAPGGVTQPIEVPGGLSVYYVADTREEAPPWAQETQVTLQRIIVPIEEGESEADAAERAQALRERTTGCESIPDLSDQAVMESIDQKLVSALPGPVRDAVRLLQAGQSSRPIRSEGSMDVFVVCDRSGGVDAEARAELREQIRAQRLGRLSDGFLQDLRREAVIERR